MGWRRKASSPTSTLDASAPLGIFFRKCSSAWARQAILRQLPQKQSPQHSAARSADKVARPNLALKAEDSYQCLTLLKSIALASWFTPFSAPAEVGEG